MSSEQELSYRRRQEPLEHQGSQVGSEPRNKTSREAFEHETVDPETGIGSPSENGLIPRSPLVNGAVAEHAFTDGVPAENAHMNGVAKGFIPIIDAIDWDLSLPERSLGVKWRMGQRVKRLIDIGVSSVLLLLLFPVFFLVALLVRLTSEGPAFYVCEYIGYRGRRFMLYKFRTMVVDAERRKLELNHLNHMNGPAFKIRDDPRITSLGRVLRKFSIDELPQLWNVFKGDMSLVGPRPPLPEEWIDYKDWHRGKLSTVPGITCYWQVTGRSDIVDFDEWASLDLKYIEGWNLWEDFKILVRTIPAVLRGHGAY
jgi:lipopolysaccharide/colanic/teichoic acid biosynthesis glycosyltransferase